MFRRLIEWARFRYAVWEYKRQRQKQWNFEGNDD